MFHLCILLLLYSSFSSFSLLFKDCLDVKVVRHNATRGTCTVITKQIDVHLVDTCLSLCLDSARCRGATQYLKRNECKVCDESDSMKAVDTDMVFMQVICTGKQLIRLAVLKQL